jgi:hypothetical protein
MQIKIENAHLSLSRDDTDYIIMVFGLSIQNK